MSLWKETTDVLMEAMSLIERLEMDRRDAEKALQEEKEKAKKLSEKLDSLCVWKQNEFPIAMQKGQTGYWLRHAIYVQTVFSSTNILLQSQ